MTESVDTFKIEGRPFDLEVAGVFEVVKNGRTNGWCDYCDLKSIADRSAAQLSAAIR